MRRKSKSTILPIGSISCGTYIADDIAEELIYSLSALHLSRADRAQLREIEAYFNLPADSLDRECYPEEMLLELYDLGQNYCPDYCYLGSHPGDGADIGVWPHEELFSDSHTGGYDGCIAASRDTASPDHSHALEVSDHGNATLWRRSGSRWMKCWAVV